MSALSRRRPNARQKQTGPAQDAGPAELDSPAPESRLTSILISTAIQVIEQRSEDVGVPRRGRRRHRRGSRRAILVALRARIRAILETGGRWVAALALVALLRVSARRTLVSHDVRVSLGLRDADNEWRHRQC